MNTTVQTPSPSKAEILRAQYGDEWDIWRELLPAGAHGGWIAERLSDGGSEPERIHAPTVEELAVLLRENQT